MAVPEAPEGKQHPQIPQGGMLVTTPMGPQSQMGEQQSGPLSEMTEAEQKAGKEASQKSKEARQKEQELGKKIMQKLGGGSQQREQSPQQPRSNQPSAQGRAN